MIIRSVTVDLYTATYRVSGTVRVSSAGVLGALSEHTSKFVEINNACTARIQTPANLVPQPSTVRVVKNQILAVTVERREDLGPAKPPSPGYSRIYKYLVRITTPAYEMEGTLEWGNRFEFINLLTEGTTNFIPLYDASLAAILAPDMVVQVGGMLFNRSYVDTMVTLNEIF